MRPTDAESQAHATAIAVAGATLNDRMRSASTEDVIAAYLASLAVQGYPLVPRSEVMQRTANRAWDLRQRVNRAVRWLREAEDIARIEMPGWSTADRIRDIYEQITDDVLNGKTTVPPLKQRLAQAEAKLAERLP